MDDIDLSLSRRHWMQGVALATGMVCAHRAEASLLPHHKPPPGWVSGHLTGAQALTATLIAEGTGCVYGIPGAQENELWDEFKSAGLPYLLAAHEFSAACMADGYARATGQPGVLCIVPGPGITNALTGIGEARLDSIPMVCIVGDIDTRPGARHFQVHALDSVALLKPVTKAVIRVTQVEQIADAVRKAFAIARAGEPGPTAVVVPYPLFIEKAKFHSPPMPPIPLPFDQAAADHAVAILADRRYRVGIYAGLGCMDQTEKLIAVAELLQAPVATSVSGKGAMPENHPLSVGWGYGAHATRTAEETFKRKHLHPSKQPGINCVLAVGVRYSEVSTGFYGNPHVEKQIHVDANADNLGKAHPADVCVHADSGVFFDHVLSHADRVCRPVESTLVQRIRVHKVEERREQAKTGAKCGIDPMCLILALDRQLSPDALRFIDVSVSEHLAAEAMTVRQPRTYFNPTDNQSMGWSIPAAIGAQRVFPGRCVVTLTGDGCFLMSAMELSTAGREHLPVKFFVLNDQTYKYMQLLQQSAYVRTTATVLAGLDYPALAKGLGVGYMEINPSHQLDASIRAVLAHPGPVLVNVVTDYTGRDFRWLDAVRGRFVQELSAAQKARFLARIGARSLTGAAEESD